MKQIKLLGFGILFLSLITSCKNKGVDFNNSLVKIQQSVQPQVQDFAKKMEQTGNGSITLKSIEGDAKTLTELLDKKIAEITAVPTMEGGEDLKNAIVDQLKFERNICYKTGRLGNDDVTEEEKSAINTEFQNSGSEAKRLEQRVSETQKKFAEKNNFKLEKQ